MAINKIDAGLKDGPLVFAQPVLNQLQALVIDVNHGDRISDTYVLQGALFCVGGSLYCADSDTAITGTRALSTAVKFTVSGDTLVPSYADVLKSDLTWKGSWQGYYDDDDNYYYYGLSTVSNAGISQAFAYPLPTSYTSSYSANTTISYGGTENLTLTAEETGSINQGTLYIKTTVNGTQISENSVTVNGSAYNTFNIGNVHLSAGDVVAIYVKRAATATHAFSTTVTLGFTNAE